METMVLGPGVLRQYANQSVVVAISLICFLAATQSLYTVERLKNAAVALFAEGRPRSLSRLITVLRPTDGMLLALILISVSVVVYSEWRARTISLFLRTASPGQGFAAITAVVAWLGHAFLFPGVLLGGDSGSHIARFLEIRQGLEAGNLAGWTNYQYLGSPLLEFTGPLLYVVGGAVDVLIRDPVLTAKVLLFGAHLASGWVFYGLMRRLGIGTGAATGAAVGFGGSFAYLHLFLYRGEFPQAFTMLFICLIFYAAEGLMREARFLPRDWLIFALSTAALIVNHQPHALFVGLYLLIFGLVSLLLHRWRWKGLLPLTTAGLAGIVTSTAAVLPLIAEADWVMIEPGSAFFRLRLPTPANLLELLIWANTQVSSGIDYWAYLGIVLVGLALLGAWSALKGAVEIGRRNIALSALASLTVVFFVFNPVVRDVLFILFFLAILGAVGFERLLETNLLRGRMPALAALALVVDVGSTSIQPLARSDKQFMIDAGRYLATTAPEERVVEVDLAHDGTISTNIGPNGTLLDYYSTIQRIAGYHNRAATRVHNYAETIVKLAERDLRREGRLMPETATLLGLLNATRVVCFGAFSAGCPPQFSGSRVEGPLGAVAGISDASPVLFSRRLLELVPSPSLEKPVLWNEEFESTPASPRVAAITDFLRRYLRVAEIDPVSRTAAALPVRSVATDSSAAGPEDRTWRPFIASYHVSLERVSLKIQADSAGYAQLSHPWYPATEVRINGRRITPLRSSLDLVVVPLEPGLNEIELRPTVTSIRAVCAAVSCLGLLVTLVIATLLHLRRFRR